MAGAKAILLAGFLAASCALAKFDAAEYYYDHGNFPLALSLWEPALKKNPRDLKALQRVAELTLLLRGRSAMAELFMESASDSWPVEVRSKLLGVFWDLQTRFLTDRAQELYLQAVQKRSRKDFEGAAALLTQASSQEPGQPLVLRALAQTEWDQGSYEAYFTSLKGAWKSYPFDSGQRIQLAEAFLYFKQYSAALSLLKGASALGERGLLVRAVSLFEMGDYAEAKSLAASVLSRGHHPTDVAVAYSLLGQVSFRAEGPSAVTSKFYSKFLSLGVERPDFDPFHLKARIAEAQRYTSASDENTISRKEKPTRVLSR